MHSLVDAPVLPRNQAKLLAGLDSKGLADPYVRVNVEHQGSNAEAQTSRISRQAQPQWHEEIVVNLHKSSKPFSISLYDHRTLLPDSELGSIALMVDTLPVGVLHDLYLPLRAGAAMPVPTTDSSLTSSILSANLNAETLHLSSTTLAAELHVLLQVTLIARPPTLALVRLSTFRLVLEKAQLCPGETVRGTIVWNVGNPKFITGMFLKFKGVSKTSWRVAEQQGPATKYHKQEASVRYFDTKALVDLSPISQRVEGGRLVGPGSYVFPFEYVLPEHLPSTFKGEKGSIRYSVLAYILMAEGGIKEVETPLTVLRALAGPSPQIAQKKGGNAISGIFSSSKVSYSITVPFHGYIGEILPINVVINNSAGKKPVVELVLTLMQYVRYQGKREGWFSDSWHTKSESAVVSSLVIGEKSGFPVAVGSKWTGDVKLKLPLTTPSIDDASSPILTVFYCLNVKISCGGLFFEDASTKDFALILTKRYTSPKKILVNQIPATPSDASPSSAPTSETESTSSPTATISVQPVLEEFEELPTSPNPPAVVFLAKVDEKRARKLCIPGTTPNGGITDEYATSLSSEEFAQCNPVSAKQTSPDIGNAMEWEPDLRHKLVDT